MVTDIGIRFYNFKSLLQNLEIITKIHLNGVFFKLLELNIYYHEIEIN